jgi:membrane protein implicated in regulation of membrane protease activity
MSHIYLGAVAFGLTLLVASLFLHGGKDTGHGHDSAAALGWAPITSLRFWVFLFSFGGGAGLALTQLGSSETVSAIGAAGVGWVSGTLAVAVVRRLTKQSVSSAIGASELVGMTGTLMLPAGPSKPGKVRVEIKGRTEDYVATVVDDGGDLPSGTPVLIVAEGDRDSLLVTKHEM